MKVKRTLALAVTAVLMFSGPVGAAGAPKAKATKTCLIAGWENPPSVCASHIKVISATCFNCHGSNGKSSTAIPSLAGQDKTYFVTAMKDFRDGKREGITVMQKYALGYTDDEYEAMAEFFAKVK
jgi:cytochrome c553